MRQMTTRTRTRKPSARRLADNILAVYDRATEHEREHAADWYREAHTLAESLSPGDIERGAGVIAALSPQQSWTRNVQTATLAFERGTACEYVDADGETVKQLGLGANCVKADRILNGAHPLDVLGGDKVLSFYDNILNPGGDAVTIDRHAYDVANAKRGTDKSRDRLNLAGMYARYVDAYKLAARELNLGALELQAIVWVAWRRENGVTA